jgi:lipopolysaccharide biosynthesis glycosyltransferase
MTECTCNAIMYISVTHLRLHILPMDIVFNINQLGLEGLGATLTSLIRNCSSPHELKLCFLCSDMHENDKNNINHLLRIEEFSGSATYVDFDAKEIFGHLRSLHGDWTGYGRLLIEKYIQSDIALYLDADLVVCTDVLKIKNFDFQGKILAAVRGSTVSWALERTFFIEKLKFRPETDYFNSGVVLFNLKEWKAVDAGTKWKIIAEKYPNELLSIDQTLLNAVCEGNFAHLPPEFNNPWYPGKEEPENAENSIIHFVGSPKPWDIFGKIIHEGYKIWNAYNTTVWKNAYSKITLNKLKRTWKIKNSLLRQLKKVGK